MDPFIPREGPSPDNPYTIFRKNPLKLLGFPFLLPPEFHEKKESLEYALLRAEEGRFTAYQHKCVIYCLIVNAAYHTMNFTAFCSGHS